MTFFLIEPQYFPNLQYFSKFLLFDHIIIDDLSNFEKQSFRNRALISGANKVQPLIVPVRKGRSKIPINEIEIDYATNWQKDQWISIVSAYNKSSFFFYYQDKFEPFFNKQNASLIAHNLEIIKLCLDVLGISTRFSLLSQQSSNDSIIDYRNCIHPKEKYSKDDKDFNEVRYFQVFEDRHGFIPNLSILDLIFNMGPESLSYLKKSVKIFNS